MDQGGLLLLATFVCAMGGSFWVVRRSHSPGLVSSLGRLFFPSWKFFVRPEQIPQLFFRIEEGPDRWGPWESAYVPFRARSLSRAFLNAEGNLELAIQALTERVAEEINHGPELPQGDVFARSVSYRLMRNLVAFRLRERKIEGSPRFQFRLSIPRSADGGGDLLLSRIDENSGEIR